METHSWFFCHRYDDESWERRSRQEEKFSTAKNLLGTQIHPEREIAGMTDEGIQ